MSGRRFTAGCDFNHTGSGRHLLCAVSGRCYPGQKGVPTLSKRKGWGRFDRATVYSRSVGLLGAR